MTPRYQLVSIVILPIITFGLGFLLQYYVSHKTLSLQELSTAMQIVTSERANEHDGLRKWADNVISNYSDASRITKNDFAILLGTSDFYIVPKEIADDVCIFPRSAFQMTRQLKLMDKDVEVVEGMNAKMAFFLAVADFRMLENDHNRVMSALENSCGFLMEQDEL